MHHPQPLFPGKSCFQSVAKKKNTINEKRETVPKLGPPKATPPKSQCTAKIRSLSSNHLNVLQVGAEVWHRFVSQRQLALQRLCDPSILDGKSIGYLTPQAPNRFLVQPELRFNKKDMLQWSLHGFSPILASWKIDDVKDIEKLWTIKFSSILVKFFEINSPTFAFIDCLKSLSPFPSLFCC